MKSPNTTVHIHLLCMWCVSVFVYICVYVVGLSSELSK